jgi:hypothetical protein
MGDALGGILAALGVLVVGVMAVSFLAVGYLLCCGPGVGALWVVRRWRGQSAPRNRFGGRDRARGILCADGG